MKSFTKAKRRFLANGIVVIEKCVDAVRPVFIRAKDEFEQFEVELAADIQRFKQRTRKRKSKMRYADEQI